MALPCGHRDDVHVGAVVCAWGIGLGKPTVFPFLPPLETPVSRPLPHPGPNLKLPLLVCAWGRDRTGDPSLFRGMLYQLSYPSFAATVA